MSCGVSNSPLHQNDDWASKSTRQDSSGLNAIAQFNASLGGQPGGIDENAHFDQSSGLFDFQPDHLEHNAFGISHQQPSNPGSPYFIPSIEGSSPQMSSYPSHFQNMHRRSISEPPMDSSHDFYSMTPPSMQVAPSAITFHRGGHYLGHPQQSRPLKSLPKSKTSARSQPYKMKGKEAYPQPRYHPRSNMSQAPTSAPMMYEPGLQGGGSTPFQSTRVCTPDPADVLDPLLTPHQGPAKVTLPVSMEELRAMIETAVHKAVQASREEKEPASTVGEANTTS